MVLQNGRRTRVRAASLFVIDASYGPGAQVLLQCDSNWPFTWDFDVTTELSVRYRQPGQGNLLFVAQDRKRAIRAGLDIGTAIAGHDLNLTAKQRRRLGALFAYLMEGQAKPADLLGNAATLTGETVSQILNTVTRIRARVNVGRENEIKGIEDLGYHLVEVAGVLGPDDLLEVGF